MRKTTLYLATFFGVLILFSSCKKEYESIESIDEAKIKAYIAQNNLDGIMKRDDSGFYYQIVSEGTGDLLKNTDSVLYDFDIKSLSGTVYQAINTNTNNATYVGYVTSPAAFRPVMLKVKRGAKVKVILPSYLAFGKNGNGNIPSNEVILSDLNIYTEKSQQQLDDNRIQAFLTAKGITATKHPSGVYYQVITPGTGTDVIDQHSTVVYKYTGRTLDGTQFDSNDSFSTTLLSVIPGWEKVLPLFTAGAKVRLFIPSNLGYGVLGSGSIPPNAVLDFTIEITSVTN
ncbi:FKBP-type peptidyl-prolyl cis-trans isomerase [Pedobacter sp. ASV28]|uniref:FKBP-type peptidyl-prolyl cis-trans isomerase n=1 Tax=Pedobacter sp. ASV28 TaxID=2795123 RepID=UPI0018EA3DAD|nr:FKBP-type peptidyl-prolyl cis-trans isomerase [Pedobacter sp. ASV28]